MTLKCSINLLRLSEELWTLHLNLLTAFDSICRKEKIEFRDKGGGELVSEFEDVSMAIMSDFLYRHFPNLPIYDEESNKGWPPRWNDFVVVDQFDATQNTVGGFPFYGVMFALVEDSVPTMSVISLPIHHPYAGLYYAALGQGAYRHRESAPDRLVVSNQTDISKTQVLFEGSWSKIRKSPAAKRIWDAIQRARCGFGTVWAITRVAGGGVFSKGFDALISIENKPTDILPSIPFITESGGKATQLDGWPPSLVNCRNMIFSNGYLHEQLVALAKGGE